MGTTIAVHGVTYQAGIGGSRPRNERGGDDRLPETLGQRIEARLGELFEATTKLLEENRHDVLALAYALEVHKTLAGEDVIAVIEGQQGPLVDGRQYHTPELERALVTYHDRAAEAHDAHADVAEPLPVLIPPPPAGSLDDGGRAASVAPPVS